MGQMCLYYFVLWLCTLEEKAITTNETDAPCEKDIGLYYIAKKRMSFLFKILGLLCIVEEKLMAYLES